MFSTIEKYLCKWLDIISNGGFVGKIKETLAELILRNFIEVSTHKTKKHVKNQFSKRANKRISGQKSSIAAIIQNIAVNSITADENTSEGKKENLEITAEEKPEDKEEKPVHGGYGTIKAYAGISPGVKYTDYGKIWSHLGTFRTNAYGSAEKTQIQIAMDNGESSREMVSYETMNKAERHFKYFVMGDLVGEVGLVPPVGIGIDSKDWEKYRLMTFMSIYRPLLKLMRSMA